MCNHYHPLTTDTPKLLNAAFTRRRFLGGMAMLSAAATVPGFVGATSDAYADTNWYTTSKPGVPEDRVLVVVQLSGGNDGLNTVVPFGDDSYNRARPGIRINDALKLDGSDGIGLNPALRPIQEMIGQGRAAVVNGVGYPNPNRSHFKSMDIWHTAQTDDKDQRGKGWVGQAMDAAYPLDRHGNAPDEAGMATVSIGNNAPMAVLGKHVQPVAFQNAGAFQWAGHGVHDVVSKGYDAINKNKAEADTADPLAFVQRTTLDAQVASNKVRKAVQGETDTRFPANPLAQQLSMVAKMIRAELPTRVYYVTLGGFDTHAQQANKHTQLLTQFAESMKAFYDELHATGHDGRVVSLAFSEFGRRLQQNASNGTDHGVAGPSFVFGPSVKHGLHGSYPSLTNLDKGDLIHTTDFRSVYADILDNWMAIDSRKALGAKYDHLGLFAKGKRA
ncbi:MAG: DUF1501 domain-containing protein [Phycisphaeraceae bacterium]